MTNSSRTPGTRRIARAIYQGTPATTPILTRMATIAATSTAHQSRDMRDSLLRGAHRVKDGATLRRTLSGFSFSESKGSQTRCAMKYVVAAASLMLALLVIPVSGQSRGGRAESAAASAPQLKFHLEEDFFKLPDNIWPSEAVGVALNSKGHIFLLNRGNHPLLEFAPDGSFIRSIGDGST